MPLQLESFTEPVASVLADYPQIELPLVRSELRAHSQLKRLSRVSARDLFPRARQPECAQSGLLLLLGGWEQCHDAAQGIAGPEGSYWHAIAHRIEPDFWNAGYWFRRLGSHLVFETLRQGAAEIAQEYRDVGWVVSDPWDPFAFLTFCERAVSERTAGSYPLAVGIQALEWQLLFKWCAAPAAASVGP